MTATQQNKSFIALAFERDRASLVSASGGKVNHIESREFMQPFGLDTLRSEEVVFDNYLNVVKTLCESANEGQGRDVGVVLRHDMVQIKRCPVALGMEESLLRDHLEWEAAQACISDIDQYTLVSHQLPSQMPAGNHLFLTVLVQKWAIDSIRRLVKKAGHRLVDIDVDVFATIRTVLANFSVQKQDLMLIIEKTNQLFSFTVLQQNDFFLVHRIPVLSKSNDKTSNRELADFVQKEVKRLVFAHRLGNDASVFNGIFLSGEFDFEDIQAALSSSLSVPIHRINPFKCVKTDPSLSGTEEFTQQSGRFITPMGLILKRLPSICMQTNGDVQ